MHQSDACPPCSPPYINSCGVVSSTQGRVIFFTSFLWVVVEMEMERSGGCCIARLARDADVAWRVGKIMLRFRPIAPKPALGPGGGAVGGAAAAAAAAGEGGRSKRRAAGGGEGKRGRKLKKAVESRDQEEKSAWSSPSAPSSTTESGPIVTLPLMPETPERKGETCPQPPTPAAAYEPPPWFRRETPRAADVVIPRPLRPAASWVTVERVTDTWQDREMKSALEEEEAPGFTSDEWDRVTWTNEAYRRMVFVVGREEEEEAGGEEEDEEQVRVGLVTKGMVPAWGTCGGFTCRVRVRYACGRKGRGSLAALCDVWRVDGGGYAWRLDAKAALSLGLGLSL